MIFLLVSCLGLGKMNESFVFTAQEPPTSGMNVDLNKVMEQNSSAKRARADFVCSGREDVAGSNMRKEAMGSFKSKLMNMSTPSSWSGLGSNNERIKIKEDDIQISEGPDGPRMTLSHSLKEQLHRPRANALILKNMGRTHTLSFMLTKLTQKWTLIGQWQLTDLGEGYFVARF